VGGYGPTLNAPLRPRRELARPRRKDSVGVDGNEIRSFLAHGASRRYGSGVCRPVDECAQQGQFRSLVMDGTGATW
jgi:hypothetical protein